MGNEVAGHYIVEDSPGGAVVGHTVLITRDQPALLEGPLNGEERRALRRKPSAASWSEGYDDAH